MRAVAIIISVLFHPLLVTSYLIAVLGIYFPSLFMMPPDRLRIIVTFIFCFTVILPIVNILMFRMFGTISTYTMDSRQERIIPFTAIALIYLVMTGMFFYKLPVSSNLNLLLVIISSLVVVATLITYFYKVSVHALAMWGCIGILFPMNKALEQPSLVWPTVIAVLMAGIVMSARLYLNAHTPRQILFGSIAGFNIGFFGVLILF